MPHHDDTRALPTVLVVGGGIAGLSAAWQLTGGADGQPRARVVVLEAADRCGGELETLELSAPGYGTVTVDTGAESMLARRPEAVTLATEVGLTAALQPPLPVRPSLWTRGALRPMPTRTVMGVPADAQALRGLVSDAEVTLAEQLLARPGPGVREDLSVAKWLGDRVGPAVVTGVVEPLLGGVYAGRAEYLSLQATLPQLWPTAVSGQPLGEAVAAILEAARPGPVFAGIDGGLGSLPDAVTEQLLRRGVRVHHRCRVTHLAPAEPGSVTVGVSGGGWQVGYVTGRGTDVMRGDAVVVAVPAAAAARLLAPVLPEVSRSLAGIEHAGVAVLNLLLRSPSELPGSGFLVPRPEGRLIKGATFSSSKWAWTAERTRAALPAGSSAVRLSVGRAGGASELQVSEELLVERGVAELTAALGHPVEVLAAAVRRWGGGLPQYDVGHAQRVARVRAGVRTLPGLAVCGSYLDGVGVPACIATGRAAADQVTADH